MSKKKSTIATTLAGAGSAPVTNLSTTQGFTDGGPNPHYCVGCDKHDVQFVTKGGTTTLNCKICGAVAEPADQGEADSLAAYNKDVDTGSAKE